MIRKLLELSVALLCLALVAGIIFWCIQSKRDEETRRAEAVGKMFLGLQNLPALKETAEIRAGLAHSAARSLATLTLEDLRLLDAAVGEWAIENKQPNGTPVPLPEIAKYLKRGSPLQRACESGQCRDALGNPISIKPVGERPSLSSKTFEYFSAVAPLEFWKPYSISSE
jgi:hypothetical protein